MVLLSLPCCASEHGVRLVIIEEDDGLVFTIINDGALVLSRESIERLNDCLNVWLLLTRTERG